MKEYPILCDKIECYKKERGCNPMKKDRLIVLTDAVLAIIMTILVLELKLFVIYGKISLLVFFPFSGWDRYGWH